MIGPAVETGGLRRSLRVMTANLSARTLVFSGFILICTGVSAHGQDGTPWIVVRDEKTVTMHGDLKDLEKARKLFRELGPGYLWFRKDGKEYVVRDGKMIEEIEELTRPQGELGQEQSRLGQRQSELGLQQAKLGRRQAELGQEQARRALLRAERDLDGKSPERRNREEEREMEETQAELSRAQETIGREQEKIGHEQEKMGREQERLAKQVQRKVEQVIEASLRNGTAKPLN